MQYFPYEINIPNKVKERIQIMKFKKNNFEWVKVSTLEAKKDS